jgi:hypothetical protein
MTAHPPIKLFQFPRIFGIPNVSPFCCKLRDLAAHWAGIPYEVVDTPRSAPGAQGQIAVRRRRWRAHRRHLADRGSPGEDPRRRSRRPPRRLAAVAIALLVQRTLGEHYAFVLAYTHILRDEGWQHTRTRFDSVPVIVRPLVRSIVRGRVEKMLWKQGVLRHSHEASA